MKNEDIINRILDTQEKTLEELQEINVTLAKQHENLKEHMKRTQQNEEAIELLGEKLSIIGKKATMVEGAFKLLGMLSTLLGFIFGAVKLIANI